MSIFSVAVTLRSATQSVEQLSALAGTEPTRAHSKGELVYSRAAAHNVWTENYWSSRSGVVEDTWTIAPHWAFISPILETLALQDRGDADVGLSIGTNSRGMGFAFDLEPDQIALLARAGCGVWIDSYEANRDREDLPDDYPFPETGSRSVPRRLMRLRRRLNLAVRNANPFGKVRRHRVKSIDN